MPQQVLKHYLLLSLYVHQVDVFLQALVSYDKEHIPESCLTVVKQEYLKNPDFQPDRVWTKSSAAAGLCAWTINIVKYYEVRFHISCCYDKYIFFYLGILLIFRRSFSQYHFVGYPLTNVNNVLNVF